MTDNPKAMVPKSGGGSGPNTEQGAQPAENVRKQINKNRKPGMSAVLAGCTGQQQHMHMRREKYKYEASDVREVRAGVRQTTAAHAHATGKRKKNTV